MNANQIMGAIILGLLALCVALAIFVLVFRPSNRWVVLSSATAIFSIVIVTILCAALQIRMG